MLLFIKYVSDKYAGQPYAPITIPKGASLKDRVALKGTSDPPTTCPIFPTSPTPPSSGAASPALRQD